MALTQEELDIKVQQVLNKLRPYLQRDGGDVEYISTVNGVVYVRMLGACVGCSSIDLTIRDGIEAILLEEVEGVIGVEVVD